MDANPSVQVKKIIENNRSSISQIDSNYLQGRHAVLEQLRTRSGQNEETRVDAFIANSQNTVSELVRKSAPYILPEDYLFFLKYYGGLFIEKDTHYFQILGIGPMVEEWYASISSDAAIFKSGSQGLLSVGSLSFRAGKYKFQHVDFVLDLSGIAQKDGILGLGPWGEENITPFDIMSDPSNYARMRRMIATSFSAWLEQAVETEGLFRYS